MRKRLLVISEPDIVYKRQGTSNNALNLILEEYTAFFDEVHYIGPTNENRTDVINNQKIYFHPTKSYSKKKIRRLGFLLFFPFHKRRIRKIVSRINPDIVQIRIPAIFPMMVYKAIRKCGIPITTYVAGEWDKSFEANYKKIPLSSHIAKLFFNSQLKIVKNTVTVTTGGILKERFAEVNQCHAYYSTTHNSVYRREQFNHPAYRILMIGRLEEIKRHCDAIIALEKLTKISDKYRLTIVGDGVLRKQLVEMVENRGLEEFVDFRGYIFDKDKMEDIYKSNDILLHPSITEGTPKVLPEAMSYGLLTIAVKDVGSINSIIENGVNGYLVCPRDPESICNAIIKYNGLAREEAQRIIANSYSYAEEHTIKRELEKMWKFVFNRIDETDSE